MDSLGSETEAFMNRRQFLSSVTLSLPALLRAKESEGVLRFGVITDVHQDIMHDGVQRVSAFVDAMARERVAFIAQLGDFCVPEEKNRAFLNAWNQFQGPRYHVLGNHDIDGKHTREETVAFYGMSARHYRFEAGGVCFIVLDGNDPNPESKEKGYAHFIAKDQLDWLDATLSNTRLPVIVMVHQPIDQAAGVKNHAEVRAVLEKPRKGLPGVAAVLSGHLHQDYVSRINDIAYIQVNSASYLWMGNTGMTEMYAPEIHKAHPALRRTAPYRDPLWAVISIDWSMRTLTLQGRSSKWVGVDPWERGGRFSKDRCKPAISDRREDLR